MLIWEKFLGENLPSAGMQSYVENVPKALSFSSYFLSLHLICGILLGMRRKGTLTLSAVSLEKCLERVDMLVALHYRK